MISFFAKPPFLNVDPSQPFKFDGKPINRGHLMRVSSLIRGIQISEYLEAKLNPTDDYENDTCIYVKPHVKANGDFNFEGKPYLDIIDGWGLIPLLKKHPEVTVITISQQDFETISKVLPNKVILIPQHHVNYERVRRNKNALTKVGVVGTIAGLPFLPNQLEDKLKERGMELVELSSFETRQKIQDFYKDLFFQIVWRPYKRRMGNPLKIVNGASFGVPTIALKEDYFKEMDGYYIPVKTLKEFLSELDKLRENPDLYNELSQKCISISEKYHISEIAKKYKELDL